MTASNRKHSRRGRILAGLALAATLVLPMTASARLSYNGLAYNGLSLNGMSINGLTMNGWSVNGIFYNAMTFNGSELNAENRENARPDEAGHAAGSIEPTEIPSDERRPSSWERGFEVVDILLPVVP